MNYPDGHQREMAKWAHDRLARQRQQAEDEQRRELEIIDLAIDLACRRFGADYRSPL